LNFILFSWSIRCCNPRPTHPQWDNKASCSSVAISWWCSWYCRVWPWYNRTQPYTNSAWPSWLSGSGAEPVVEMGPSWTSLANYCNSRTCSSGHWARTPCIQA